MSEQEREIEAEMDGQRKKKKRGGWCLKDRKGSSTIPGLGCTRWPILLQCLALFSGRSQRINFTHPS